MRRVWTAGAVVTAVAAAMVVTGAVGASATTLEPNPCAGQSDHGTGGSYMEAANLWRVYGTWYNCSGGTGSDRVKLNVGNSTDGPCITVAYGSTGSSLIDKVGINPYASVTYEGWIRC
jgi:hypothetical protein